MNLQVLKSKIIMAQDTPEKEFENPNDFYKIEEAKRYETNSGMKRTQTELTKIVLELFIEETKNKQKEISILDIGCGTGFSLEFLKQNKYNNLIGIEPAKKMLDFAKKKGFKVYSGGFLDIPKDVKNKKFDLIISVSALQWILTNKQEMEIKNISKALGKELKGLLAKDGIAVIQYYPPKNKISEILLSGFERTGLKAREYLYNKGNSKKEKHILIIKN